MNSLTGLRRAPHLTNCPGGFVPPCKVFAERGSYHVKKFWDEVNEVAFAAQQRLGRLQVPEMPHFDSPESTSWFLDQLGGAKRYLEYGTGGSTYQAARVGVDFIAVDTDPYFLDAVRTKIQDAGLAKPGQVFRHADIGRTGTWGRPRGKINDARRQSFHRASDPPPECVEGLLPDLVLIDGRFRVACAFKVFNMLNAQTGWTVVVDDYTQRPQYREIEDYADVKLVGRMAVIQSARPVPSNVISHWETDFN